MTKEELRKEATTTVEWESTPMIDRPTFINGYITSAEPREKHIEELEVQIERMKCGGNCENRYEQKECTDCHNYSKWKFKQAEQFYEEIAE